MESIKTTDISASHFHNLDKGCRSETINEILIDDKGSNDMCDANEITAGSKDDDQDSIIIEEAVSKVIDLNDESDEEELEIVQSTSNITDSTKATEFVIVNAAHLPHSGVEVRASALEHIQVKDELAETITPDLNTNDVLENDPMDLLELNQRSESSNSVRSQDETDYPDDVSSIGSSSVRTGSNSSVSVYDWVKDYPWLLYEEGDEQVGFCLYCDANINTKSQRSVKQHGMSLYHKERCENYLAFREEEEKNGLGMQLVEIKEEFGTDSRVEALKLKRKSQSAALNNFNWRRWLNDYPWLERDSSEGTTGFCKYCHIHINAEFSYLRDRHQEGAKHRENEKLSESKELNESASIQEDRDFTTDNSPTKNHKWLEDIEGEPTMAGCKVCGSKMIKKHFLRHLTTKVHEHNEKIYLENQKGDNQGELEVDQEKTKENWKMFSKIHPWLMTDPENSMFAYCKYCEKRIIYGASAAKRAMHEHSLQHKQNETEFKKRSRNLKTDKKQNEPEMEKGNKQNDDNNQMEGGDERDAENEDQDDDNEENNNDEEDNETDSQNNKGSEDDEEDEEEEAEEEEEEEEEEEDDIEEENEEAQEDKESENEKKRPKVLTNEWFNQYSWCKRYKKDPKNFIYCIYCKTTIRPSSRKKHLVTSMHKAAEKEFLNRQAKKQKQEERRQNNENSPSFEWAIPLRNNPSNYSCLYCRVRISKNYSKKQHASSKIHQINESIYKNNRRKSSRNDESNTETSQPIQKTSAQQPNNTTSKKTFAKVVIKTPSTVTIIKQHQKKFPWLSYKRSELRSNYGHCKVCDSSLFIRSFKHILRHTRSTRHISILRSNKKQKVEKDQDDEISEVNQKINNKVSKEEPATSPTITTEKDASFVKGNESQKGFSYKSTISEMKKRYSWIEKSDRLNYAYCRFCNTNIPLKILFLRNHSNSLKHRRCVISSYSINGKKISKETDAQNNSDANNNGNKDGDNENDDVVILEENNEEILISEQDENWTIKSETMDEHEELDYLLQRSFNNSSNTQRNNRKSINTGEEPPTKRVKRSQSFRRLNDSNTSLVASLLTTPLTLASCLGPLIQQQIQQANLSHTQSSSSQAQEATGSASTTSIRSENTYDLFFKSVSETMKKLPADLAAEGKLRVMQVLCDLELQALKREQSVRIEPASSNFSVGINNQSTPTTPAGNLVSNSSLINDATISPEQNGNINETIITQLNVNTGTSPTAVNNIIPQKVVNTNTAEKPSTSVPSPIIGVMDKNGLQTLQLKASVQKQISRNTTNTTITSVANSGIRCIPFKNLSQPVAPDSSNPKMNRIQVPMNVATQSSNQNANTLNTPKNLINFRNIQITKRMGTPPTSVPPASVQQQTVQKTPTTMANKSPQRTYITNIQPQLQRWGCSVNGSTAQQTPTSTSVTHIQQLSSQRTSTPTSRK